MATVLPGYVWLKDLNRYRDTTSGQFVSSRTITDILRTQTSETQSRLNDIATSYHEGRISPSSFVEQLRVEVRRNAIQNVALAKGGFNSLTQSDYGRIGQTLRTQYAQISGTAQDVIDGKVSIAQLQNRINGYAGEGKRLYYVTQKDNMRPSSFDNVIIARRQLGDAMHCADCPAYDARGWVLLAEIIPPGVACQCQSHCQCGMLTREIPRADLAEWLGTKR